MQVGIKMKCGRWRKGESGNPAGRPKDPRKLEVIEIFKNAAPELLKKAIKDAKNGDKYMLGILVKKALPDNLNLGGEAVEGLAAICKRIAARKEAQE